WIRIAKGCGAGISADGRTIAFTDGRHVWAGPPRPGGPTRVLSAEAMPDLQSLGIHRFQLGPVGISVGAHGFAVPAGSARDGFAIVALVRGRPAKVVPLGRAEVDWMGWQPKGDLLAFNDFVDATQSSEIRIFDPETGALRELAVTQSQGMVWAPGGGSLAIFKGASVVA